MTATSQIVVPGFAATGAAAAQRPIGYLIPEFPAQTHAFFWREKKALALLGLRAELLSTRPPRAKTASHDWAKQAAAQTRYLFPPTPSTFLAGLLELLKAGPRRIRQALRMMDPDKQLRFTRRMALLLASAELLALARRGGYDHIHVHSCADAANTTLSAHILGDLSYSVTLHGPLADYGPNQPNKWRHARFAIVITRQLLAQVRQSLPNDLPADIIVAPMGVELNRFARRAPYTPYDGSGPFRLFSCGRLNPVKGHDDLVLAVAQLRQRGIDARLTIAGEDEAGGSGWRQTLQAVIATLAMTSHVRLLGAVSESTIHDELEHSHAFALASHHEPLGVAIMEAMAMSLPTVATNAGGVPELIDDQIDGILVPPRQPSRLADALQQLTHSPELALRLSRNARAKIESSFHSGLSAQAIAVHLK